CVILSTSDLTDRFFIATSIFKDDLTPEMYNQMSSNEISSTTQTLKVSHEQVIILKLLDATLNQSESKHKSIVTPKLCNLLASELSRISAPVLMQTTLGRTEFRDIELPHLDIEALVQLIQIIGNITGNFDSSYHKEAI